MKTSEDTGAMGVAIVLLGTICTLILILAASYGLIALVTWAIFSCFGWPWSWQMALGIWLLTMFLKWMHLKPIEEAAEIFGAWQEGDREKTLDECADAIQAIANLCQALGQYDMTPYMVRCRERNEARGRIYGV